MAKTTVSAPSTKPDSTSSKTLGSGTGRNHPQNPAPEIGQPGRAIGYARVSRADQSLERQLDALRVAGCTVTYEDDGVSGSRASRPGLDAMLAEAVAGDVIVIQALDRLGRSTRHLLELLDQLTERGIALRILNLGADTGTPAGQMVLTVMAAVAQLEREQIRERTIDSLAAARARGRVGGRPRSLDSERTAAAIKMREDGMTLAAIARVLGVSERTVGRAVG